MPERAVGDALDGHVDGAADQHRHDEDGEERQDDPGGPGLARIEAEDRKQEDRDETAKCEQVAVSEVDELDDPVDHRVAEGDQRVDGPVGHAERQDLQEVAGALRENLRRQDEDRVEDGEDHQ